MVAFDITERPVLGLSARKVVANYHSSGAKADIALGGLPFQFAITDEIPYQRQTAEFRRQQIDTSKEPGEQTLSQWWVRDQDSWHRGAGASWYEPGSDSSTKYRYARSIGVDVWTKGDVSLLHRMETRELTDSDAYATGAVVAGQNVMFTVAGGVMRRDNGEDSTLYTGATALGTRPVIAGSKVLAGTTEGIVSGDVGGAALTPLWTYTGSRLVTPYWVKARIIATAGPALYELTLAGGAMSTPLYTHPSPTFIWTAITEAPGAILAAGRDGGYGFIYRFVLEAASGASVPTLGAATPVATFPPGEEVYAMDTYLGAYLALGTSRGVRIGQVDPDGTLVYGPLTVETSMPVRALAARDRFVYAGIERDLDGVSGCARIDLSEDIPKEDGGSSGRYAWAYDAPLDSAGQITSVAFLGTTPRVVLTSPGYGVYVQSASAYVGSGYLLTGKIRYATSEQKRFALLRLRAQMPSTSTVDVATVDSEGAEKSVYSLGAAFQDSEDLTLQMDDPQQHISLRFTLRPGATGIVSPTIQSYQVKATPLPRIQRVIQFPVFLLDRERDANNVTYGFEGAAVARLQALEDVEARQQVVVFEDYTSGESFSVQIRSVRFVRRKPPSRGDSGFGGIVVLELLRL